MRPAQVSPQWCKLASAARISKHPKQPSSAPGRQLLKSKAPHSLSCRLLTPRYVSKWLSNVVERVFAFAMVTTLDREIPILIAMQNPIAKLTNDLLGLARMQTAHPELLLPTSLPRQIEIGTPLKTQEHKERTGLADKAVTWMLAPVFFCCLVAEKAKPPQTWEATEVFSRVVVSFMLKLFLLTTEFTGGKRLRRL